MARKFLLALPLLVIVSVASPALAQMSAPPIPSALPGVAKISVGNAVGVLQYCAKHSLVSSTSADQVVGELAKKPGVTSSADYARGQNGEILGDDGKNFAIAPAPAYLQVQACDMVLKQAKAFP